MLAGMAVPEGGVKAVEMTASGLRAVGESDVQLDTCDREHDEMIFGRAEEKCGQEQARTG